MILAKDETITMGGTIGEISAEVTGILQALREHLKEAHGEENAEFLYNEIVKVGSMTDEESDAYIKERMKTFEEAGI